MTESARYDAARRLLFAVGLGLALAMTWRAQIPFDQYAGLVRGWLFYTGSWIVPFGNHMSAGGFQPGPATSVLTGLPLFFWEDYRAVNLATLLFHVAAYLLLDRSLRETLDSRGRLLLCLFYWVNPWHLYFAGHLWNPNWLFLLGALHLWSALKMRERARFGMTLLHVSVVALAFQLHASFLILALASALLWWRGYIRVHWLGVACGGALLAASLVPWLLLAIERPEIVPVSEGFIGRGLVTVHPILKGLLYWLRYPVLYFSRRPVAFDFTPILGASWDALLVPFYHVLTRWIGPPTLLLGIAANVWIWRRRPGRRLAKLPPAASKRDWVLGYVRWVFVGALISFALSPTSITMWQVFIVMHAAVLPMVFWVGALWRTPRRRLVGRLVAAHAAVVLVILVGMTFASPMYRDGGRQAWSLKLSAPHPMIEGLGLLRLDSVTIDPLEGVYSPLLDGPEEWYVPLDGPEPGRM